jgi:hypothetical protein
MDSINQQNHLLYIRIRPTQFQLRIICKIIFSQLTGENQDGYHVVISQSCLDEVKKIVCCKTGVENDCI